MITNIFHNNSEYIGINIERINNEFVVCVAFKTNGKWKAMTMGGFSGGLCDEKIFERVVKDGRDLDELQAYKIFSNAMSLKLEYYSK